MIASFYCCGTFPSRQMRVGSRWSSSRMGCVELLGKYRQQKMAMESALQIRCWQVFLSWKVAGVISHIQRIVCQPGKTT